VLQQRGPDPGDLRHRPGQQGLCGVRGADRHRHRQQGGADRHGDGQAQRGSAAGTDPLQHLRADHSGHRRLGSADGAARHGAHLRLGQCRQRPVRHARHVQLGSLHHFADPDRLYGGAGVWRQSVPRGDPRRHPHPPGADQRLGGGPVASRPWTSSGWTWP